MVLRLFGLKKKPARPETAEGQGQTPVQVDEPSMPSEQASARPATDKAARQGTPSKRKAAAKKTGSKSKAKAAPKKAPAKKTNQRKATGRKKR